LRYNTLGADKAQSEKADAEKESILYVKKYGAYLNLYNSLVAAADNFAEGVLRSLLELAAFDPHHMDIVKRLSKRNSILFYEPVMLSGLLVQLQDFPKEKENRRRILSLLSSAYPDVKPWQVQQASSNRSIFNAKIVNNGGDEFDVFDPLYFEYLSMLLDPDEGSDGARRNRELVKEWCILSTSSRDDAFVDNFVKVSSKRLHYWRMYYRDLPFLLDLSMSIRNYALALELCTEIIDSPAATTGADLHEIINHLRFIGKQIISSTVDESDNTVSTLLLQQVIGAFNALQSSKFEDWRSSIWVPEELFSLLMLCDEKPNSKYTPTDFITLMARNARPHDTMATLSLWNTGHMASNSKVILDALRTCMQVGAELGTLSQLSGSLLRIQQARVKDRSPKSETWQDLTSSRPMQDQSNSVWNKVMQGDAVIDKK